MFRKTISMILFVVVFTCLGTCGAQIVDASHVTESPCHSNSSGAESNDSENKVPFGCCGEYSVTKSALEVFSSEDALTLHASFDLAEATSDQNQDSWIAKREHPPHLIITRAREMMLRAEPIHAPPYYA